MGAKGVYKWMAVDRVCNTAMTFGGNIVLAHLLDPEEFGLVAMLSILIALAYNFSGCGMSDGLIYKECPTQRDYSTVMTFNAAFGLFFCLLFIALSGATARFFNHEEVSGIMKVLGICFFFQTLTFTQETRLRKELDMRSLAIVHLLSTATVTVLGILMALNGWGYWSLVMTHSGLSIAQFIYYLLVARWMPRLAFYAESFRELFGYGVHLMLAYVVNQIGRNISTTALGKFTSPAASGLFAQAQKLEEVPFNITEQIFNWPFFSVLCNESDPSRRRELCSEMHTRMWWVNLTVAALLLLVSWPAFNLLYGAKWDDAIPVFRLLLVYGVFTAMKYFYQVIFKTYGRPKLVRNLTFIEVSLQLLLLVFFYSKGLIMVAMTQVVAAGLIMVVHAIYYKSVMHFSALQIVGEAAKALIVPAIAFGVGAAVGSLWYLHAVPVVNCLGLTLTYLVAAVAVCEAVRPAYYLPLRAMVLDKFRRR